MNDGKSTSYPSSKGSPVQFFNFSHAGKTLTLSSYYKGHHTYWSPTKDIKVLKQGVYRLAKDIQPINSNGIPVKGLKLKKGLKVTSRQPLSGLDYREWAQEGYKYIEVIAGAETYWAR